MISLLGALASILFAVSAIPAAIKALRLKKTGTPVSLSVIVLAGVVTMWLYVTLRYGVDFFFTINSISNTICWSLLLFWGIKSK
jgi:hypothetical protein